MTKLKRFLAVAVAAASFAATAVTVEAAAYDNSVLEKTFVCGTKFMEEADQHPGESIYYVVTAMENGHCAWYLAHTDYEEAVKDYKRQLEEYDASVVDFRVGWENDFFCNDDENIKMCDAAAVQALKHWERLKAEEAKAASTTAENFARPEHDGTKEFAEGTMTNANQRPQYEEDTFEYEMPLHTGTVINWDNETTSTTTTTTSDNGTLVYADGTQYYLHFVTGSAMWFQMHSTSPREDQTTTTTTSEVLTRPEHDGTKEFAEGTMTNANQRPQYEEDTFEFPETLHTGTMVNWESETTAATMNSSRANEELLFGETTAVTPNSTLPNYDLLYGENTAATPNSTLPNYDLLYGETCASTADSSRADNDLLYGETTAVTPNSTLPNYDLLYGETCVTTVDFTCSDNDQLNSNSSTSFAVPTEETETDSKPIEISFDNRGILAKNGYGDFNQDGMVNKDDYNDFIAYICGVLDMEVDADTLFKADFDGDGMLTMDDAVSMKSLLDLYTTTGTWDFSEEE